MRRAALVFLLSASSCTKPTESPDRPAPTEPPPPLRFARLPALVGEDVVPPYLAAAAKWKTATVAYTAGDGKAAGEQFLEVAATLMTSSVAPHGLAFRAARCLAYDNAASAFGDAACPRLEGFKTKDTGCGATIRKICASTSTTSDP